MLVLPEYENTLLSLSLQEFDHLLKAIYKGPLEARPWESFLGLLKDQISASHCVITLRPAEPNSPTIIVAVGPMRADCFDSYNERFFRVNPFADLPPHKIVTVADLMTEEEWVSSVFYRDYLKPEDIRHFMAVQLKPDPNWNGYSLMCLRSHSGAPFGRQEKELIHLLLPHLQQAVELRSNMENLAIERQVFAGTVDRMQVGTIMLDEKCEVLSLNAMAQAILKQRDGISLFGKVLKVDYAEEHQQLKTLTASVMAHTRVAIAGAHSPGGGVQAMAITRPSGRPKLSALIRLIPAGEYAEGWNRPRVAIFLRDPESQAQGSTEVLCRLFELTRAEARLALLMANGLSLEEAGDRLSIRRNTVRAHLRAIFSKMGVTRQTELVRLVSNSVVELA